MPLIDTGRGIRSQRLRLTPSPDGRQLLVHRSDLHPTVMPTAGALLRHGRVIYDLTRGEPHDARLACGSLFLIDVDSTRLLSRSSSTVAVWDPTSTRIVTVHDAQPDQRGRRLKDVSAGATRAAVASLPTRVRCGWAAFRVDWVVTATRKASPVQRAAWHHQMSW